MYAGLSPGADIIGSSSITTKSADNLENGQVAPPECPATRPTSGPSDNNGVAAPEEEEALKAPAPAPATVQGKPSLLSKLVATTAQGGSAGINKSGGTSKQYLSAPSSGVQQCSPPSLAALLGVGKKSCSKSQSPAQVGAAKSTMTKPWSLVVKDPLSAAAPTTLMPPISAGAILEKSSILGFDGGPLDALLPAAASDPNIEKAIFSSAKPTQEASSRNLQPNVGPTLGEAAEAARREKEKAQAATTPLETPSAPQATSGRLGDLLAADSLLIGNSYRKDTARYSNDPKNRGGIPPPVRPHRPIMGTAVAIGAKNLQGSAPQLTAAAANCPVFKTPLDWAPFPARKRDETSPQNVPDPQPTTSETAADVLERPSLAAGDTIPEPPPVTPTEKTGSSSSDLPVPTQQCRPRHIIPPFDVLPQPKRGGPGVGSFNADVAYAIWKYQLKQQVQAPNSHQQSPAHPQQYESPYEPFDSMLESSTTTVRGYAQSKATDMNRSTINASGSSTTGWNWRDRNGLEPEHQNSTSTRAFKTSMKDVYVSSGTEYKRYVPPRARARLESQHAVDQYPPSSSTGGGVNEPRQATASPRYAAAVASLPVDGPLEASRSTTEPAAVFAPQSVGGGSYHLGEVGYLPPMQNAPPLFVRRKSIGSSLDGGGRLYGFSTAEDPSLNNHYTQHELNSSNCWLDEAPPPPRVGGLRSSEAAVWHGASSYDDINSAYEKHFGNQPCSSGGGCYADGGGLDFPSRSHHRQSAATVNSEFSDWPAADDFDTAGSHQHHTIDTLLYDPALLSQRLYAPPPPPQHERRSPRVSGGAPPALMVPICSVHPGLAEVFAREHHHREASIHRIAHHCPPDERRPR